MPNWTHNVLRITGDEPETIKQMVDFFEENTKPHEEDKDRVVLTFQGAVPRPKDLDIESPAHTDEDKKQAKINLKKYGATDWYDWNHYNWGTKWNADTWGECYIDLLDDWAEIVIQFNTAWSPPLGWLEKVSKKYPLLQFEMDIEEESNAFMGYSVARGGILKENIVGIEYPTDKEIAKCH